MTFPLYIVLSFSLKINMCKCAI